MSNETKRNRNYRKIWSDAYGTIPKDAKGRSLEIHHINGDHYDNRLENLTLVSIDEHYKIHYEQGDWAACQCISKRMRKSVEEHSRICTEMANNRVKDGTNPFLGPEVNRKNNKLKVENGTHPFLGGEIQRKHARRRVENGTHPFLGGAMARKNNRQVISLDDGKITTYTNKSKYEVKTGYIHTWIDL